MTREDNHYRDYVRQKIQQGIDDAAAGRVVCHGDVKERLANLIARNAGVPAGWPGGVPRRRPR